MKWFAFALLLATSRYSFCCQNITNESLLAENGPLKALFEQYLMNDSVTNGSFKDMLHSLEVQHKNTDGAAKEDKHCDLLPKLLREDDLFPGDIMTPIRFIHICPNILLKLLEPNCQMEKGTTAGHGPDDHSSHHDHVSDVHNHGGHDHSSHDSHDHGSHDNHDHSSHDSHDHSSHDGHDRGLHNKEKTKQDRHGHGHHRYHEVEPTTREAWIGALFSQVIIGIFCLGCIMIIPMLKKSSYYAAIHHFFLALAVGTLAGDALIHLIPHALIMDVNDFGNIHLTHSLYGLTAFMGILTFLLMEQIHNLVDHNHSHGDANDDSQNSSPAPDQTTVQFSSKSPMRSSFHDSSSTGDGKKCFESCPSNAAEESATNGAKSQLSQDPEAQKLMKNGSDTNTKMKEESIVVVPCLSSANPQKTLVRQDSKNFNMVHHEYHVAHHGHSHHGHSHITGKKNALRAMILLGDGMHTAIDGMAIGVAFGTSLTGGVATAIAVLCHELPHKLGDFAILFEMGMTIWEAVKIIIILWALSMLGAIIGVAMGSVRSVSPWIYCFTAGVFLYLALVDLLSEISINSENAWTGGKQIALQFTGILIGAALMMVIAIYEHDLQGFLMGIF